MANNQKKVLNRAFISNAVLMSLLTFVWLLHFLQVLTPETGFDALWYHLPIARSVVTHGAIVYNPNVYQSINPLFSDLFFITGYAFAGPLGSKVVAYGFGLVLLYASYLIARKVLRDDFVYWALICISLIQVVAWQSASFYVDIAKAVWELFAVFVCIAMLERKKFSGKGVWQVGLLLGASIGTKAFSILLIPYFIYALWRHSQSRKLLKNLLLLGLGIFIVASPYYINAYLHTGNPFFTISQHTGKLLEIGGSQSLGEYILKRIILLPTAPIVLLTARDYISPVLIACLPLITFLRKQIQFSPVLRFLTTFALYQSLIWWFIPPTSTRYALSGFIILIIITVRTLQDLQMGAKGLQKHCVTFILVLSIALTIAPRIYVAARSITLITHNQSESEYLHQFRDGNIDKHMDAWYGIYNTTPMPIRTK